MEPTTSETTAAAGRPGRGLAIAGLVSAGLSVVILPVVLGLVAVVTGILAMKKGERSLGRLAIILGVVLPIVGTALAVVVLQRIIPPAAP